MNYQKIYNQIIERAKSRQLEGYKEKHHIIPRCMGGNNDKINLVELTAREHFLCHRLLTEIYPNNEKLWYALFLMSIGKQKNKNNRYIISNRTYEKIKIDWVLKIKNKSKPKNFMTPELRQKISQSNKGISRNKGTKFSKEVKEKMSRTKKGKIFSSQHIENLKIGIKNRKSWVKSTKPVLQYNLQDEFIQEWASIKEINKKIKGDIRACCLGKQKTAGGFKWKYAIRDFE
jgi:hypothetical protein